MTGKDARPSRPRWRTWLSVFFAAVLVIAGSVAARRYWGPGSLNAQTRAQVTSAARTPVTANPPARTSAGTVSTSAQSAVPSGSARAADTQGNVQQLAAVVNGQQVTREDLARECLRRYGQEVLESLVNKHLIWQACQQRSITITEQDVENEVNRMAQKFGLSTDRWLTMLEKERDINPNQYRREIIWPTIALRRLAADQIVVTPEELRQAFESEYGTKVKVRMISVSSRQKAEQVRQLALANPEKFGDLAKEHSEDANSAGARGLIPPIRKHLGQQELEKVAFSLKEGEISPLVQVANQYLILRCEKHLPETYISSQNLKPIQDQLHDQIRDQKLRTAASELFKKLQAESKVVNVYNDPKLREQMPGVAATINGRPITLEQLSEECLIRNGKEVVDGEINRLLLQQELQRRGKAVSQADIDEEIARAADAYGYLKPNGSPDVDAWLKAVTETDHVTVDLYVRDAVWPSVALKLLVREKVEVTKEDLDKGFAANYGERVEVLAVVLGNQRQANTVWEMARNNPSEQFFGDLANQYSVEPVSRSNLGKVPPIRRYGGQPVVEEEAFRLKPGEVSGIIAVGDRYIILKCLGRTQPVVQDFASVEKELRKDIQEKKLRLAMADEFDRLKEAAKIDNLFAGKSQPGERPAQARTAALPTQTNPPARSFPQPPLTQRR